MLLRKVPEVRTLIDTGGRRRKVDFEVAVLWLIFLKILFSFGTLYFVSSFCTDILWGTLCLSSIARILRLFRSWYLNSFLVTTVSLKDKSKNRRHSKSVKFLALLTVTIILKSNSKFSRPIPISFFRREKNYLRSTSIIDTLLYFHQISEPPLWMLHLHLNFFKHLNFSSILFANNFPVWFMYYSSVVSKFRQGIFVPISSNKCLIPNIRRKLEPNKLKYLTIGSYLTDICFLWFSFIVDSGSRKWWINQGLSINLGALYKYSSLAYEGDVPCGQYIYNCNTDSTHSLSKTTQQVTFVLFVTSLYFLLLWKGNDHNEDMGRIVTAKNHVDKNVRTFVASLLPLCSVMLV
jgi:hypothetical protein